MTKTPAKRAARMRKRKRKNAVKTHRFPLMDPKHPKKEMTMVRRLTQSKNKAAAVNKRVFRNTAK